LPRNFLIESAADQHALILNSAQLLFQMNIIRKAPAGSVLGFALEAARHAGGKLHMAEFAINSAFPVALHLCRVVEPKEIQ
jgi:hypothetical protein